MEVVLNLILNAVISLFCETRHISIGKSKQDVVLCVFVRKTVTYHLPVFMNIYVRTLYEI